MTLFIQQSVLAFDLLDETQETKTPVMWVNRVDAMMKHFHGDHSDCSILERYVNELTFVKITVTFVKITVTYHFCLTSSIILDVMLMKSKDHAFSSS